MFSWINWRQFSRQSGLVALALATAVVLMCPGAALAQGGFIPLSYGDTVSGVITGADYEVVYVFNGQAGDVVTAAMDRTDMVFDPYLVLYDAYPSQNPLAFDDDGGGELNALIGGYVLPATGTYYLVATRYGRETGMATGSYVLTLTARGAGGTLPDTVSGGAFGGLPIGDSGGQGTGPAQGGGQDLAFLCDEIEVPAAALVTFENVRPGFTYRVTVLGLDDFDPVIGLESEAGDRLCNDDEPRAGGSQVGVPGVGLVDADNLTAQLVFTTSGAVGDIQMRIGGFGGRGGRYAAVFEGLAIAPSTEQDAVTVSVSDSVLNEPLLVYMVSQNAGLDPYMRLSGTDIICDDAGVGVCADTPAFSGGGVSISNGGTYIAGQYDAGIGIMPNSTGDRTFIFESYNGGSAGNYAMIIIGAAPGAGGSSTGASTPNADEAGIAGMQYGDLFQNVIDDANYGQIYVFEGRAGDTVTITMEAASNSTLDPYLYLLDIDETLLAEDDDSAGSLNSMLIYTLPADGTYIIVATRYGVENGSTTGAYTISLASGGTSPTTGGSTGTSGGLDYALSPNYGSTALQSGFAQDPFMVEITSGGPVSISQAVGGVCSGIANGYATAAPDYRLQYTAGNYNLRIFFLGDGDTTMVINAPDGSWYCDDDGGGLLQPMVTFTSPMSGQYDIWVGSYSPAAYVPGSLYITERDLTPEGVAGSSGK